jgi:predicted nucleic acid-binding protein
VKHLIVNASPLILLGKIGRLELLDALADRFSIPNEVVKELDAGPDSDPARQWLLTRTADREESVPSELDPRVMAWGLGSGETAVISMVIQKPKSIAVLDDRAARKCAAVF